MPLSAQEFATADFHHAYLRADPDLLKFIFECQRKRMRHIPPRSPLFIYDADDDVEYISPYNPKFDSFGTLNGDYQIQKGDTLLVQLDTGQLFPMKVERALDPLSPFDVTRNRRMIRTLKMTARACDGVTVTTETLAEVYRKRYGCKKVYVYPNSLLLEDYPQDIRPRRPRNPTILWEGGSAHYEDWMSIGKVLGEVLRSRPNARMITWGQRFRAADKFLPEGQHVHHEWIAQEKYSVRLATLGHHICIAPLADTQFSRCKSNIRWLENSAIAQPAATLAANLPPYQMIEHGKTGLLYDTPEEFAGLLTEMIDDLSLCGKLARNAHKHVWGNYNALDTCRGLERFYREILYANPQVLA